MSVPPPLAPSATAAGDAKTTYILQKKYSSVGCYVCKAKTHTHLSCPKRPCYLCKQIGHLSQVCPFRLKPGAHASALRALISAREKRGRLAHFLRYRETQSDPNLTHPTLLYFPDPQFRARALVGLRRIHPKRITAAEWHVQGGHFVTGDKGGGVRVWSVGDVACGRDIQPQQLPTDPPAISYAHHCNLTGFAFDPAQPDRMYSCASDGIACQLRIDLMKSAQQQHELADSFVERDVVVNMNPGGWHGQRDFKMAYGMAYDGKSRRCLYVGASNGEIWRVDPREGKGEDVDSLGRFHKNKVTCIDVNPVNADLLATASNDAKVCLWDARKFGPQKELGWYEHGRVASSAFFSPNTGAKLLTTSLDNRIHVWNDVHGFSGCVNVRNDVEAVEIVHSHDFHRYLNAFKAVWDPKDWKDDLFMCGRFMGDAYYEDGDETKEVLLHPIDMFSASSGSLVHSLFDPVTQLICTTNRFSPVSDLILTAASGDIVLWAPPTLGSKQNNGSLGRRRGPRGDRGRDSSDDEDDDGDGDGDERDANDEAPRKKRKKAIVTRRKGRSSTRRKAVP